METKKMMMTKKEMLKKHTGQGGIVTDTIKEIPGTVVKGIKSIGGGIKKGLQWAGNQVAKDMIGGEKKWKDLEEKNKLEKSGEYISEKKQILGKAIRKTMPLNAPKRMPLNSIPKMPKAKVNNY